jgi:putative solute:sodium symporter small subunit
MSRYWKLNQWLIAGLLTLWAVVTFGVPYFALDLRFKVFGAPFSFWMAAQGALLVYLAIVGFYGWAMNKFDAEQPDDLALRNGAKAGDG